jgi:serine/threonine-protein phosphatase 2A regulatory subunit B'
VTKANGSKPVPPLPSNGQPTPAVASLSNFGVGGGGNGGSQQQGRNSSPPGPHGQGGGGPSTPDRKQAASSHDKTSPAPPVVVVSTEMPQDPVAHSRALSPSSGGGEHGSGATPPKAGPLGRLRGVKDTIPVTGKTPRKQRSSRFHVTEKHELEKLPQFHGASPEAGRSQLPLLPLPAG